MSTKVQNSNSIHLSMQHLRTNGITWGSTMSLESKEERVKLLKAGYTYRDIETLYLKLNSIKVIGVNWEE